MLEIPEYMTFKEFQFHKVQLKVDDFREFFQLYTGFNSIRYN